MSLQNEIDRQKREEIALQQHIASLKSQESQLKESRAPITDNSREAQINAIAEQRALLEAKLNETTQMRQANEIALNTADKFNENENRGEIDTQQAARDKIADEQSRRQENVKTYKEVAEDGFEKAIEGKIDPITAAVVVGVAAAKIGKDVYDDFKEKIAEKFDKDAAKEWEKDVAQKEADIKDSQNKQLEAVKKNELMLEVQKEDAKKFPDSEKQLKNLEPLEKIINDEKNNIENRFNNQMQELNKEKEAFQKAMEATNEIKEQAERNKAIEKQRQEFERQRELERQR